MGHISLEDSVFVHGWMVFQGSHDSWWAYYGGSTMYSRDRDDLLLQIAEATGHAPGIVALRERFQRGVEQVEKQRAEDELWELRKSHR